jgi:NAD(P)H-dependent FMN reductase
MTDQPGILAFAGSTRADSFNKKMVCIAADGARAAGVQVTLVDLRDYAMPLYDGDLEAAEGLPAAAQAFKQLMIAHDGFLIAAPEYNSSISAVLKNTIDWVSRPVPGEPRLVAFQDKVAALMSAAAGGFGGVRSLAHVRTILGNIGVVVLPEQVTLSQAMRAFQPDGNFQDEGMQVRVADLGARLATFLQQLRK